jgi:NitT/TauT family transport system permease protein
MNFKELSLNRKILLVLVILFIFNLVCALTGLFRPLWHLILIIDFGLLVLLTRLASLLIPARHVALFEKGVAVAFPLVILFSWEMLVEAKILSAIWFPPPTKIIGAMWKLSVNYDPFTKTSLIGRPWLIPSAFSHEGWAGVASLFRESHVFTTLYRLSAGFVVGAIPGLVLGVYMGMSRIVRIMLDPIISATYVVPKITILPLMMLIFDPFGETYQIVTVAIGVFFLVLVNTMVGVRDIDPILVDAGRNFGSNPFQLFRHIIIPGAMPFIFAGMRLGLGVGLVLVVAIEFLRGEKGVGYITWYYWEVMVVENMYAGLIVIMLLGVFLTMLLQAVERWCIPWQQDEREVAGVRG